MLLSMVERHSWFKWLVVKAHGSATAKEMKNAIVQCIAFAEENITQKVKDQIVKG